MDFDELMQCYGYSLPITSMEGIAGSVETMQNNEAQQRQNETLNPNDNIRVDGVGIAQPQPAEPRHPSQTFANVVEGDLRGAIPIRQW